MPFDPSPPQRACRIAVIGSGIAGLAAAWLLSRSGRHHVTIYERDARLGGHSNTVEAPGPDGPVAVDTGFIVYNELNYPNLDALFRYLDVTTKPSEMSFAASIDDGDLEYSGSGLNGLFAQKRNIVRPRFWRMLKDIMRFYREGPRILLRPDGENLTLGDFLHDERYSHAFVYNHLLPMAAAIWSTAVADMRDHPASAFVRFCANHGLMRVSDRPQWRTVAGGSREYVRRMAASFADGMRIGAEVVSVRRSASGVIVVDASGAQAPFDHVVIAAHADQALAMLDDPTPEERDLLGAFRYARNRAVLHQDPRLMPRRRGVWSSWNYLSRPPETAAVNTPQTAPGNGFTDVCVTYWMNRLQGLDLRVPLFVTLNPHREPESDLVLQTFQYDHPTYDGAAMAAQRRLWSLQGVRNTWYCGSYFGAGFHEDALQAGLAVAEALGSDRRPWTVADPSGRLHLPTATPAPAPAPTEAGGLAA